MPHDRTRPRRTSSTSTSTPDAAAAALRADVRAGLTATPKSAAAEVVLRRPRQRAVRGDHPAAGVLPDPGRARDPRPRAPTRSPRVTEARTLVELGSGSSEKTRLLLDALRRHGSLRQLRARSTSARRARARRAAALAADYPGLERARRRRRLRPSTSTAARRRRRGSWPSSAAPSATSCPASAPRSCLGRATPRARRRAAARHRPGQGPGRAGPGLRRRGRASRPSSTATCCACSTASSAPTSTSTRFDHVAVWDAEHEWIEMRLRSRARRRPSTSRRSTCASTSPTGEEMRTEISAKFRRGGVEAELTARRLAPRALVDRRPAALRALAGAGGLTRRGATRSAPGSRPLRMPASRDAEPSAGNAKGPIPEGGWGLFVNVCPAASYSPTPSPVQYHRR